MVRIPDDEPNLPSYKCLQYREKEAYLNYVWDAWVGKKGWKEKEPVRMESPGNFDVIRTGKDRDSRIQSYLPQETKEPNDAYGRRVKRSLFKNFFKKIISGFSGMFTDFKTDGAIAASLEEWITDVDMKGSTLQSFLRQANALALRDGFVGIYVDFPVMPVDDDGTPLIQSASDEREYARRPYLRTILRRDMLSWIAEIHQGQYVFDHVVVRENTVERDYSTKYGDQEQTRYRHITRDFWELLEIREDEKGKPIEVQVDAGENTLGIVPLVLYTLTDIDPLESDPPLYHLAELTFSYYELYSSYREVIHKCNMPVPVRKGFINEGMMQEINPHVQPLIIGTNHVVDLPADGDFFFAEPTGAAIASTREELLDLAKEIVDEGLSFVSREGGEKTATEMELTATQTKSIVLGMAENMESSVEQIFSFWSMWEGSGDDGGTILINRENLEPTIEAVAANVVVSMVTAGVISREAAITELRNKGFFSEAFDLDRELSLEPEVPLYEPPVEGQIAK